MPVGNVLSFPENSSYSHSSVKWDSVGNYGVTGSILLPAMSLC